MSGAMSGKSSGSRLRQPRLRAAAPSEAHDAMPSLRRGLSAFGLFAGIGGFELGLQRAGHQAVGFCDIDEGACAVLRARFPGDPIHSDVREIRRLPADVELLTAGFPCQDLSQAGRTTGITGKQSGLVEEVFRLLAEGPVPWLLIENVSFMLHLQAGRALALVLDSLERLGYRWAYRVVDSRAFGLPQRRQRVFILASLVGDPRDVLLSDDAEEPSGGPDPMTVACGFYWTEGVRGLGWAVDAVPTLKGGSTIGIPSPPAILLPDGRIVTPNILDAERFQGFPADWTLPAAAAARSSHRWKLVGNAVTVDVAEWIGMRLRSPRPYEDSMDMPLIAAARWPLAAWGDRSGRFAASVSMWPQRVSGPGLESYLVHEPAPLSVKATSGFLSRTRRSTLRFPDGFLTRVENHLRRMVAISESRPVSNDALPSEALSRRAVSNARRR